MTRKLSALNEIVLDEFTKKSLRNGHDLSLVRLSHRNELKMQKKSKTDKNFAKTHITEAIKIISYYLKIVFLFQLFFKLT